MPCLWSAYRLSAFVLQRWNEWNFALEAFQGMLKFLFQKVGDDLFNSWLLGPTSVPWWDAASLLAQKLHQHHLVLAQTLGKCIFEHPGCKGAAKRCLTQISCRELVPEFEPLVWWGLLFIFFDKSSVFFGSFSDPCRVRCISLQAKAHSQLRSCGGSLESYILNMYDFSFVFLQHSWVNYWFLLCYWHFNHAFLRRGACFVSGVMYLLQTARLVSVGSVLCQYSPIHLNSGGRRNIILTRFLVFWKVSNGCSLTMCAACHSAEHSAFEVSWNNSSSTIWLSLSMDISMCRFLYAQ